MIRYATFDDAKEIWGLLMLLHAEQALFSLDYLKLSHTLATAIGENRVLVSVKDGKVTGTFAWAITETYFSTEQFASDLWLFVHPEHRTGTAALRLMRAMKADAREKGVKLMTGALGKEQRGARLFNRDPDFEKVGELFLMRN